MRIAFNHYIARRSSNGALYFYSDTTRLLSAAASARVRPEPHDIFELMRSDEHRQAAFVRALGPDDVVVCNAGPYGHLYHRLRERFDGRFRIVRDVRTSAWAGFHLQELLAGPLQRPGDIVLFPSEFCRAHFIALHDHLHAGNTALCYPLAAAFPPRRAPRPRAGAGAGLRVGYLGRISADKNFSQVLDFFAQVRQDDPRASLVIAGALEGTGWGRAKRAITRHLAALGMPADAVHYRGHLPYDAIWSFFAGIDLFFFPAVSSVESLGRVLIEAQHAGVPTIAARYAAAPEILPAENLLEVEFVTDREHDILRPFSFGRPRLDRALDAVRRCVVGSVRSDSACFQAATYLGYVTGERLPEAVPPLDAAVQAFIDALEIRHDWPAADPAAAHERLDGLARRFGAYFDNAWTARIARFGAALVDAEDYPQRRALAWHRLLAPGQRLLPSHAREHCHAAGYRPMAVLHAAAPAAGL